MFALLQVKCLQGRCGSTAQHVLSLESIPPQHPSVPIGS